MTTSTAATSAPGPVSASDLDLSVLERMVGHDPAKFRKFARLFLESAEDVLAQVDTAMGLGDLEALAGLGHRAKSTALNIGATGFSSQCLLLEQSALQGDAAVARATAGGLRPLLHGIRAAIDQRLAA